MGQALSNQSIPAADRLARGLYWDRAWSLVQGCTPCDLECEHCWAAAEAAMRSHQTSEMIRERYAGLTKGGRFTGVVRTRLDLLDLPLSIRSPAVWAIWTDLFHKQVDLRFIACAWVRMVIAYRHRFLVCTKRPRAVRDMFAADKLPPRSPNIALGTTVGHQGAIHRIADLALCRASLRYLSHEPLLGPLDLRLSPIDSCHWAVIGCESGPGRRPCKLDWVRDLVGQLRRQGVAIFIKQLDLGGRVVKRLEGFPADLQIRELPKWFFGAGA